MDLTSLGRHARLKMDEHGLTDWSFGWDNARQRAGVCRLMEKRIQLSRFVMQAMPETEQIDTVLHEIAHALAGSWHGHDDTWKSVCVRIGADPTRCYEEEAVDRDAHPALKYPWIGRCSEGHETGRYQQPVRVWGCPTCSPRRFNDRKIILEWRFHGRLRPLTSLHPKYQEEFAEIWARTHGEASAASSPAQRPVTLQEILARGGVRESVAHSLREPTRLFRPGTKVRFVSRVARFGGLEGTIAKVGRTRYHVRLDGMDQLVAVAFRGVEAL